MKYFIARYYFNSLFKEEAASNFFDDIQRNPVFRSGGFSYAIGHVAADNLDGIGVIRGQIGRIPAAEEGFVYNTEEKEFIRRDRGEFADIILEFCIIPDSHLLLVSQHSSFKAETVISKFKQIYLQSNQSYVSSFSIDFLTDTNDVYEEISHWARFTKVKFQGLRPSNPRPDDDYANIEEMLKDSGADRVNIEAVITPADPEEETNTPETRSINADSLLIRESLALSSHGYGRAELAGIDQNGEEKIVKNYKYRKTVDIDFREDGSIDKIRQVVEGVEGAEE